MSDYYKSLGITRFATQKDIKAAFKQLARQYHPDKNDSPDAVVKFQEVKHAYDVLSNESERMIYDSMNWGGNFGVKEERKAHHNATPSRVAYATTKIHHSTESGYYVMGIIVVWCVVLAVAVIF